MRFCNFRTQWFRLSSWSSLTALIGWERNGQTMKARSLCSSRVRTPSITYSAICPTQQTTATIIPKWEIRNAQSSNSDSTRLCWLGMQRARKTFLKNFKSTCAWQSRKPRDWNSTMCCYTISSNRAEFQSSGDYWRDFGCTHTQSAGNSSRISSPNSMKTPVVKQPNPMQAMSLMGIVCSWANSASRKSWRRSKSTISENFALNLNFCIRLSLAPETICGFTMKVTISGSRSSRYGTGWTLLSTTLPIQVIPLQCLVRLVRHQVMK